MARTVGIGHQDSMQEAYVNGYWKELAAFTRSLFNAAFKTNPFLERAIMTGITRVSRESIFSDLNNLKVVTTTSKGYAESFGFTEDEVFAALDEQIVYDQLPITKNAIWSLLAASGYLKVIQKEFVGKTGHWYHMLAITNREVYLMFEDLVHNWFSEGEDNYNDFIQAFKGAF